MNRLLRHLAPAAARAPHIGKLSFGAAWFGAAWLGAALLACLPSEDLSHYLSGSRSGEPGASAKEPVTPGPSETPTVTGAENPLAGTDVSLDCGGDCTPLVDAGATVPDPGAGGGAGPVATAPDAGAPENDGGASPADAGSVALSCAVGAVLGPADRCFALESTLRSFGTARSSCQSRGPGWDLTTIHDPDRNAWLATLLGSIPDAWVGATDLSVEGEWRWLGDATPFWIGDGTTGSSVGGAYESWSNGGTPEPNGDGSSDCARLRPNGGWADAECPTLFASVCEGPPL